MKPINADDHDHDGHHELPDGVSVAGEGTGFEYLYRPGEVLTTAKDARRVTMALRGLVDDGVEREDRRELGLVRFRLPELVDVPRLVRTLRDSLSETPCCLLEALDPDIQALDRARDRLLREEVRPEPDDRQVRVRDLPKQIRVRSDGNKDLRALASPLVSDHRFLRPHQFLEG